jgi:hypothetical protein
MEFSLYFIMFGCVDKHWHHVAYREAGVMSEAIALSYS